MGDDKARFTALCQKPYGDQAVWFLNGFWKEESLNGTKAEQIWEIIKTFQTLDPKGKEGNELNEFDSHRLLEKYDETLSVVKMREALRDIDQDANGKMAALEYLIWRYKKSISQCVNSPQGDNTAKIEACQRKIDEVQSALQDVQQKAEQNKTRLAAQKQAVAAQQAAIKATAAAIQELEAKESELRAAEAESVAAVAELKAQEKAYADKVSALESKSQDTSIGVVTRNKAANELAQLKGEDPLPLRKAKITQEAAVRRVQKAQVEVAAQKAATEDKKREQEAAEAELRVVQQQLEEAQRQLEAAEQELQVKMAEAQAELQRVKDEGGVSHGNFWFMERQLYEADESLARARQKYDHTKPFAYSEQ